MQQEKKRSLFWKNPSFLVIVLALAILLTAAVGTLAWLKYIRSQQTVTLVHVSDYYLVGPDGSNSTALNLGSIDVSKSGSKLYAFGVKSTQPKYRIQLGYTTNIPFTYKIYRATKVPDQGGYTKSHAESGFTLYYNPTALTGKYLNLPENSRTANNSKHEISFGKSTVSAQKYAEPVYWQSDDVDRLDSVNITDYFVMEVTWSSPLPNDKETDMIYLTVGAPLGGS